MKIIYYSARPEKHPAKGYWDQAMLDDILTNPIFESMDANEGAVVIIPGAYQAEYIDEINAYLEQYKWVLLFITSDEESKFPVEEIKHPNIKIWIQYSKKDRHNKYGRLPLGYTTDTRKNLEFAQKDLDIFYSGQKTHKRREECSEAISQAKNKYKLTIIKQDSPGFSQGYEPKEYMGYMNRAKVAPAPAGPISADSFRTYEALEAGAVPIADNISLAGDSDYWRYLFGEVPFAILDDYESLAGYAKDLLDKFPQINIEVQAWWIKKKRDLMWQFIKDIEDLTPFAPGARINKHTQKVTVIVPVSPIPSHPSTEILEATIKSIRYHLPDSELIITFDGVRKEQEDMRVIYNEFIRRALFLCNTKWNAIPIVFQEHTHQVGMARVALEEVKTPVILYCEQDTPLVTDEPIQWEDLIKDIENATANVIRFHFEAVIPEPHKYLMQDLITIHGALSGESHTLLQTVQWSQRPHLASTAFYKWILKNNFSEKAKCFIEDKIHSVVQQDYREMGYRGWDIWKLFIYYPDPKNIKRSLNNDGRAGGEKYDATQVF